MPVAVLEVRYVEGRKAEPIQTRTLGIHFFISDLRRATQPGSKDEAVQAAEIQKGSRVHS